VKAIVTSFNKLNRKHRNFIETMEREELAAFIDTLARATGYDAGGQDITTEWRAW
jgi:hypothetical protein